MSLHIAAQHLASKGRGPDTMLVHMAPQEIAGLQALALKNGGSLTINPETGLPEAGFLSAILPMAAGFALGPAGFGLMSSLGSAATVGGLTTLATGSLSRGLMSGLGAYGGASFGAGALEAGADAAMANAGIAAGAETAAGAGAAGTSGAFQAGTAAANQEIADAMLAAKANAMATPFQTAMSGAGSYMAANPLQSATVLGAPLLAGMAPTQTQMPTQQGYAPLTEEQKQAAMPYDMQWNPAGGGPDLSTREKTWFNPVYAQHQYAEGGIADIKTTTPLPNRMPTLEQRQRLVEGMPEGASLNAMKYLMGLTAGASGEQDYQAPATATLPTNTVSTGTTQAASTPTVADTIFGPLADTIFGRVITPIVTAATGGTINSAGGRFLRGGGDGVSDSIPATINGREPAKLADGEFVVPARVVSEIGNGSSEAGARKLYAMMDRVQKRRAKTVGKGKIAVDSKAERLLPA